MSLLLVMFLSWGQTGMHTHMN